MKRGAQERHANGAPQPWHALDIAEVERQMETGGEGLSQEAAKARLAVHGPNQLEEAEPISNLAILLHQFTSPLIYILLAATVVTVLLQDYVDAAVIAAVLILNAVIGFTQERRAENSARALMKLLAPRARVIRAGREWDVESRELVPGDVVLLESGVRVPADLRLVSTTSLSIDESLLTGESLPVLKNPSTLKSERQPLADRTNMAFSGAVVTSGRGRGYVTETGGRTVLGTIAAEVRQEVTPQTPLQLRMNRFARAIGVVVLLSAAISFVIGVILGEDISHMFIVAVALAVAAIPEGLPVVFTITLALGVRRMAKRNAIIRRLAAVETLGSTSTVGSDKTGTLTQNRMSVQEIWAGGRPYALDSELPGKGSIDPKGVLALAEHQPLYLTLLTGILTNEAQLYWKDEHLETQGDPTEAALLVASSSMGLEPTEARTAYDSVTEMPFEPEHGYSASVREHEGRHYVFVKGAPEKLLQMASSLLTDDGPAPMDQSTVLDAAREMASHGLRVLAMAYRELPGPPGDTNRVPALTDLTFLGLQGMMDPPREGVREAIAGCQAAGMRVVMITGDHPGTAKAIAATLGISEPEATVLTGAELEDIDDAELARRVRDVSIYARVTPNHKLRVVRALQSNGAVVGVTGDGVNDAPALKAADIGIAMGRSGTDVAREAADIILADDNFVSIYAAVEEGRITFDNVRKVSFFLISTGAAAIITIFAALVLRWPIPFLPAQLLWMNLVTKGLQDVALAFEPGEKGVLNRPPRSTSEGILSRMHWEQTAVTGVVMAAGTLFMFSWSLDQGASEEQARTVALTTMVLYNMVHLGNARSETRSVFRLNPFSNRFLFVAATGSLVVHVAAMYLPPTQFVLRVEPLEWETWVRMIGVSLTILVPVELYKLLRAGPRQAKEDAPA